MGAFSTAEREALAKAIFTRVCLREQYDKRGGDGGQWVTIGGGPGPSGERHAGGTPVKIAPGGEIAAGPKNLAGKHIDQVDQDKQGAAPPKADWPFKAAAPAPPPKADWPFKAVAPGTPPPASTQIGKQDAAKFRDASGALDMGQYADHVAQRVQSALDQKQRVTLLIDDQGTLKRVPIVAVNRGMMQDNRGQRWGTLMLAQGDAHVEIGQSSDKPPLPRQPGSNVTPGAPKVGGPPVNARQHGEVKQALGHPDTLAAYYHDGAYYFLHGDAPHAEKVLGATAVTHEGLPDALNKLVKAGHRVGIAEPAGTPAGQKAPRQQPALPAKPEPARPLLEAPPAARPGEAPPGSPPAGAHRTDTAKPVPGSPAASSGESTAKDETPPPVAPSAQSEPEHQPDGPAAAAALERHKQLNRERQARFREKRKQQGLFDKLQAPDSPEAKEMPTAAAIARGIGPHRLKNEHGEAPPQGVSVGPGGIWTGTATLHADDIQMDPSRFQYKVSGIGKSGVTKQLADVKRFNPMFGGQILVWRDPADGKSYVINGHHRVELAKRSGPYEDDATGLQWQGEMQSFYIPAKSAEQARAWGAIANMAAGHGTATDAAKYLRDSGDTIEGLQAHGVSLKGKLASDALQLKDLSRRAFDDLVTGLLPESRAVAVAAHLKDPEGQDRIFQKLADREREGRPVTDQAAAAAARVSALAKTTTGGAASLFGGDDEESVEVEYGEVIDSAQRALTSERNTFKAVTSARRAGRLQEGGNVLDTSANKERAQAAENTLDQFNKLAYLKGEVSSAINAAAERLHREPHNRKEVLAEFVRELPATLDRSWQQFQSGGQERYSARQADAGRARGSASGSGPAAAAGNHRAGDAGTGPLRSGPLWTEQLASAIRPVIERYAARWDESKHPRGQPENAGEFAPIGSHAATSSADYRPSKPPTAKQPVPAAGLRQSLGEGKSPEQAVAENLVPNHPAVHAIEKQYPPAFAGGHDTLERHRGADGQFTPQRQALHDTISRSLRAGVPQSEDKTYFMMGGGPASGKSNIITAGLVRPPQAVHVDADSIKGQLPEYKALLEAKDQRAAAYAHEESSHLGKSIIKQSLAAGQNVLLDGTGNSSYESVAKKVQEARAAGYKVNAEYVTCSVEEAVRRNLERAKKTGRLPPESMLRATHRSVSQVLPQAVEQGLFDNVRLWDTENKDAQGRPTLVMSAAGRQLTIHHPQLWEAFQAKGQANA